MIPADGEAHRQSNTDKLRVRLLDDNMDSLDHTVVIAGCSPVISLFFQALIISLPVIKMLPKS